MGSNMAPPPTRLPGRFDVARSIVVDVTLLAGAGLVAYGSWLSYPPAGFIVTGLVLLGAGLNGARR